MHVEEIISICNCFSACSFVWCKRVANEAANFLALLARKSPLLLETSLGWISLQTVLCFVLASDFND